MRQLLLAVFAALSVTCAALAKDIVSVRMRTEPSVPYVGEDFELVLEVTAEPGSEIRLTGISGIPNSLPLTAGPFSAKGVREGSATDGATVHVHSFSAPARASKEFLIEPRAIATLMTMERVQRGFFTSMSSRTQTAAILWPRFEVRALPEEGRPEDFSGAVGRFKMQLEAAPLEVMPQDIVELKLTLSGTGFLGDATPSMPRLDPGLFKTYPPTIKRDEDGARLVISQSVIPLSTNAVEIGSARLPFFDATIGAFTNAMTAPIRLVFRERRKAEEPAVREVKVDAPQRSAADEGVDVSKYLVLPHGKSSFTVSRETSLRIAPGPAAKTIITVPAGSEAVPLETERGWLRVKVLGRTGWMAIGNGEQGTGNGEQGTGNREQGTGNREQRTKWQ